MRDERLDIGLSVATWLEKSTSVIGGDRAESALLHARLKDLQDRVSDTELTIKLILSKLSPSDHKDIEVLKATIAEYNADTPQNESSGQTKAKYVALSDQFHIFANGGVVTVTGEYLDSLRGKHWAECALDELNDRGVLSGSVSLFVIKQVIAKHRPKVSE